jgi:hypothetical protein
MPAQQNNNGDGPPVEVFLIVGAVILAFALVWFTIRLFFTLTIVRALRRCHPRNVTTEPALMWLNLIPLVHVAWNFVTAIKVAESLREEFIDRGWHRRGEDYGYGIGLAMSILQVCGFIPYCGALFGLGGFVCFIIYWVKIAGYSRQLASREYDDEDDDRDDEWDDEDDRRGQRRGRDDDRDGDSDRDSDRPDGRPWDRGAR